MAKLLTEGRVGGARRRDALSRPLHPVKKKKSKKKKEKKVGGGWAGGVQWGRRLFYFFIFFFNNNSFLFVFLLKTDHVVDSVGIKVFLESN